MKCKFLNTWTMVSCIGLWYHVGGGGGGAALGRGSIRGGQGYQDWDASADPACTAGPGETW